MTEIALARARAGDGEAFRELIGPYRGELQAHSASEPGGPRRPGPGPRPGPRPLARGRATGPPRPPPDPARANVAVQATADAR